jgi:dihydroxyacetone kinase
MLDAFFPFAVTLRACVAGGESLRRSCAHAAQAAAQAAEQTAALVARMGRSRLHGEKSLGTPDPGAVSFALVVGAVLHGGEGEHG